jgi:hypothetical protein
MGRVGTFGPDGERVVSIGYDVHYGGQVAGTRARIARS